MAKRNLKVTTLDKLKTVNSTQIVELGEFDNGVMLTVEMKKLNVLKLIKNKMLPNNLLSLGTSLVDNPAAIQEEIVAGNTDGVLQALEMADVILENTFVEPKYTELRELGIELTTEQLNNALIVAMSGAKALEKFRENFQRNEDNSGSEEV